MLVKAQAHHGFEVVFQRDKAVQRGPQTVAAHGQDDGLQRARVFHQVNDRIALAAADGLSSFLSSFLSFAIYTSIFLEVK